MSFDGDVKTLPERRKVRPGTRRQSKRHGRPDDHPAARAQKPAQPVRKRRPNPGADRMREDPERWDGMS